MTSHFFRHPAKNFDGTFDGILINYHFINSINWTLEFQQEGAER